MTEKNPKPQLVGLDPTKAFYLAVTIGNLDGSLDEIAGEGVEGVFDTEADAIEALRAVNEDYPTVTGYAFYCVPVKKIWRGKIKVTSLSHAVLSAPKSKLGKQ